MGLCIIIITSSTCISPNITTAITAGLSFLKLKDTCLTPTTTAITLTLKRVGQSERGTFGVLNSGDVSFAITEELPWRELRDGLLSRGWLDLNQTKTMINIKGHKIELRGTDDAHLNRDDYALVSGAKNSHAELSIGVTHAPYARILDAMAADSIDLIFAGHTHGGQVRLPLPTFMGGSRALTTNCDLPTWRSRGLSVEDGKPLLHVSAGIGTSPFAPFRVGTRPEATLVVIQ